MAAITEMRACIGIDAARRCAECAPLPTRENAAQRAEAAGAASGLDARTRANTELWTAVVAGTGNLAYRLALNTLVEGVATYPELDSGSTRRAMTQPTTRTWRELCGVATAARRRWPPSICWIRFARIPDRQLRNEWYIPERELRKGICMRITVIGSTGQTGRHVLQQGSERGHAMVAFARHPETLPDRSAVTVVSGDGRDPTALTSALAGSAAVIAIVGAEGRRGRAPGGGRRDRAAHGAGPGGRAPVGHGQRLPGRGATSAHPRSRSSVGCSLTCTPTWRRWRQSSPRQG